MHLLTHSQLKEYSIKNILKILIYFCKIPCRVNCIELNFFCHLCNTDPVVLPGEKPMRRRRNSSRSSTGTRRKRTLSGRSLSDYSDQEIDAIKQDLENHDDILSRGEEPMEVSFAKLPNSNGTMEVTPNSDCDKTMEENSNLNSADFKLEVLNFVREKLYTRFVVSASELRRLFQMHLAQCPPGHVLSSGVSDKMLEESILNVGGIQLENQVR